MRTFRKWKGPLESYRPSSSFWTPQSHCGPRPYDETLKIAGKLKDQLSQKQRFLLMRAATRPWDWSFQAKIQWQLANEKEPLFPKPKCETGKSIDNPGHLRKKHIIFVPRGLVIPEPTQRLLENRFLFNGFTPNDEAVYLARTLTDRHILKVGMTGTGKTVHAHAVFLNARNQGRWAFIHSKNEE